MGVKPLQQSALAAADVQQHPVAIGRDDVLATPVPRRSMDRPTGRLVQEPETCIEEAEDDLKHPTTNSGDHVTGTQT